MGFVKGKNQLISLVMPVEQARIYQEMSKKQKMSLSSFLIKKLHGSLAPTSTDLVENKLDVISNNLQNLIVGLSVDQREFIQETIDAKTDHILNELRFLGNLILLFAHKIAAKDDEELFSIFLTKAKKLREEIIPKKMAGEEGVDESKQ